MGSSASRIESRRGPAVNAASASDVTQFAVRDGVIDLAWGHPDPALLPIAAIDAGVHRALARHGADALAYGAARGPGPFIEAVRHRLSAIDGRAPGPDEILLTSGNSAAIDLVLATLSRPGDLVLVASPTYHLALRILGDHPVEIREIPTGPDGMDVDALDDQVRRLRGDGRSPRLIYSVPTYGNPTGTSLSATNRAKLAALLARERLVLIEDDAYRELGYGAVTPDSIWSIAEPGAVVRLGSFSKSLAPGMRIGYATASREHVTQFAQRGVLDSGGGSPHFTSLVVADLIASGEYERHVERLRREHRHRRDSLVEALGVELAPHATWEVPSGGYFVWVDLPGVDQDALLASAEREGVGFVPGRSFFLTQRRTESHVRLAFSRYPPQDLREAVRRLATSLRLVEDSASKPGTGAGSRGSQDP